MLWTKIASALEMLKLSTISPISFFFQRFFSNCHNVCVSVCVCVTVLKRWWEFGLKSKYQNTKLFSIYIFYLYKIYVQSIHLSFTVSTKCLSGTILCRKHTRGIRLHNLYVTSQSYMLKQTLNQKHWNHSRIFLQIHFISTPAHFIISESRHLSLFSRR